MSMLFFRPGSELAEFYQEFTELYKTGYAWSQIGWEGAAAILRNTFSISHLISMKQAAWDSVDPTNYLAGHERKGVSLKTTQGWAGFWGAGKGFDRPARWSLPG